MISAINDRHVDLDFSWELSTEEHAMRWKQRGGKNDFEDMEQFLAQKEQQGLLIEGAGVSHQPANTHDVNELLRHVENSLFPYTPFFGDHQPQRHLVMELMRYGVEIGKEMEAAYFRKNVDFGHPYPVIPVENRKVYAPSECHLEDPNQPTPFLPRPEREIAKLFEQLVQSLSSNENEYQIIQKYIIFNKSVAVVRPLYYDPHPLNRYFTALSPAHHQLLYATIVRHAPQYEISFLEQCDPKAMTCNMSEPELISWLQRILQLEESPRRKYAPYRVLKGIQDTSRKSLLLHINFVADQKSFLYLSELFLRLIPHSILIDTSLFLGATLKSEFLSGRASIDFCEKSIKFSKLLKIHLKRCASSSQYKKWKRGMLFELHSAHAQKSCLGWNNLPHYEKLKKEHPDFHNQFKKLKKLFS